MIGINEARRLTQIALRDTVSALRAETWDVRAIHADGVTKPICRVYARHLLFRPNMIRYFRFLNFRGYHIFGRPNDARHILIDDLDLDSVDALIAAGLRPSLVVQTSKGNFQAWVTVSYETVDDAVASATARLLAKRFVGDPGSAKATQLGRLPGLFNKKPIHTNDGLTNGPLVTIRRYSPGLPRGAAALLQEAEALAVASPPSPLGLCETDSVSYSGNDISDVEAAAIYREVAAEIMQRLPNSNYEADRSRLDYAIARRLHLQDFSFAEIECVLRAGSAKALERGDNYLRKTVLAALKAPGNTMNKSA